MDESVIKFIGVLLGAFFGGLVVLGVVLLADALAHLIAKRSLGKASLNEQRKACESEAVPGGLTPQSQFLRQTQTPRTSSPEQRNEWRASLRVAQASGANTRFASEGARAERHAERTEPLRGGEAERPSERSASIGAF